MIPSPEALLGLFPTENPPGYDSLTASHNVLGTL